ncbi:hypothetical protein ACSOTF_09430 [Acinetobacter baumannii]|uniref:hypothetical protein n=1 Tax=Acinetobacter baumannii TaxID=470 RepID=UPI003F1A7476
MSEFKVGQILVKRNTLNQPSKSTSLWKVVYVYTDAVEVVPLKDGKELKMLQGIYGSAMFNPASTEEVAAGHRIDDRLKATDTLSKMRAAVIGSFKTQDFNACTRRKMMILKRAEQALKVGEN